MATQIQSTSETGNDNFWPENIGAGMEKPPVAFLQEQAEALTRTTNNVLKGIVVTDEGSNDWIVYSLFIEAPRLDGYRYRLLSLTNAPDELYPVHIIYDATQDYDTIPPKRPKFSLALFENSNIADEDKLQNRLRETFSSEASRKLISSLLTQSEAIPA